MTRILTTAALLAVAAFCVFGFLATFEPPGSLGFRVGYGAAFVLCLLGIGWTLTAKSRGA